LFSLATVEKAALNKVHILRNGTDRKGSVQQEKRKTGRYSTHGENEQYRISKARLRERQENTEHMMKME
jgi:hypothetical protein